LSLRFVAVRKAAHDRGSLDSAAHEGFRRLDRNLWLRSAAGSTVPRATLGQGDEIKWYMSAFPGARATSYMAKPMQLEHMTIQRTL
jgi:hypothetical protein